MGEIKSIADSLPPIGSKFVAFFSDGSGSQMFWRHDHGYIDCEGGETEVLSKIYDRWMELPQDFEFSCETGPEAMTLRRIPQESASE